MLKKLATKQTLKTQDFNKNKLPFPQIIFLGSRTIAPWVITPRTIAPWIINP